MKTRVITSLEELRGCEEVLGFDTETYGPDTRNNKDCLAVMLFYRPSTDESLVYPVHTIEYDEKEEDKATAKEILPTLKVIGHWLQYDNTESLYHYGVQPTPVGDTYLLACMFQWEHKGLKSIAAVFAPESPTIPIESVQADMDNIQWSIKDERQLEYMAGDPYKAWKCHKIIEEQGRLAKLGKGYKIDIRALPAYCEASYRGMVVDTVKYSELMFKTADEVDRLDVEFQSTLPRHAKAGSAKDLQRLLFLDLGLPETPVRTGTGAPSVSAEALNYLVGTHPCIQPLMDLKHAQSVLSGSKKLPEFLGEDSKVHPEFKQIGEDGTSRVYTTKPSANQYPRELRECIVPEPGKKFLYFDWSAAELILAAYWAGCTDLLEAYQTEDLHRYVASRVLKKSDISKEERNKVKVVVFSTLFGSEGDAAARSLMIPLVEAQGYVQEFFRQFQEIAALKTKIETLCEKTAYTHTIYGRPRKLPKIRSYDPKMKGHALRQAFNTAIQGSVADLLKIATAKTRSYADRGIEFSIGVFDSLLMQVPETMTEEEYIPIIDKLSTFGDLKLKYKYAEGMSWRSVQDQT